MFLLISSKLDIKSVRLALSIFKLDIESVLSISKPDIQSIEPVGSSNSVSWRLGQVPEATIQVSAARICHGTGTDSTGGHH